VPPAAALADILRGVEKAIGALPKETAELWQVAFKILKGSHKPKDLTRGEVDSLGLESQ
jgi:hypothetical protein